MSAPARRAFLCRAGLAPLGLLALDPPAVAAQDASAVDALDAIERLAAGVVARLQALDRRVPAAHAFLASALRDHERLVHERAELRGRLRLPPAPSVAAGAGEADRSLAGLREAQDALVYAHAEALPALRDPAAVDRLARHLTELARHLTVIDLWIEAEAQRG